MFYRFLVFFLFASQLLACAYNYEMGVPKNALPSEFAVMKFHNNYKVSVIDGEKFSRKLSIWEDGSHTIKMVPGVHSFTLTFDNRNLQTGGYYTTDSSTVTVDMEAGKTYEIVSDIGLANNGRITFKAVEVF